MSGAAPAADETILVLDTSSRLAAASYEVTDSGMSELARFIVDSEREHAEMIDRALRECLAPLPGGRPTLIAVGVGPGAYTGLRAGLTAAHMLNFAWGVPVTGVMLHDALYWQRTAQRSAEVVVTPAGRKQFYWSCYCGWAEGLPVIEAGPALIDADDLSALGDDLVQELLDPSAMAQIAWRQHLSRQIRPAEPIYLRHANVTVKTFDQARIEPAQLADLPEIMRIEREVFAAEAWSVKIMLERLQATNSHYFVLRNAGAVVGYAGLNIGAEAADIENIAVDPLWRRRGAGQSLLECLIDCARGLGMKEIFLDVKVGNDPARRLYEQNGFRAISTRPGYYQGVDGVVMRRCLTEPLAQFPTPAPPDSPQNSGSGDSAGGAHA